MERIEITVKDLDSGKKAIMVLNNDPEESTLNFRYVPRIHAKHAGKKLYSAIAIWIANTLKTGIK